MNMNVTLRCPAVGCAAPIETEVGPDIWDETYEQCPECGVRFSVWLSPETRFLAVQGGAE